MEMIECAGYSARISPAACLARYRKAHETPDPLASGYVGLEKCLECGIGMKLAGDEGPRVPGVKGSPVGAAPRGRPVHRQAQGTTTDTGQAQGPAPTKVCKECRTEKPMTDFQRHNFTPDGRHTICKDCHKAKIREKSAARIKKNPPRKKRVCTACGKEKPLRAFAASPVYPDGYNPVCSMCVSRKISAKRKASAMEKQEEKRVCKTCGVEKPIEAFGRYAADQTRRLRVCKVCISEKMSAAARKRQAKNRKPLPLPPADKIYIGDPPHGDKVLRLAFDGHEDLLEQLQAAAAAEIRTPEQQVLYWIKMGVAGRMEPPPVLLSSLEVMES